MLILDEPTSGVDPLARDRFWDLLIDLSRKQGVTIFVSTHFMNEAARCDRISLMDAGRVLATDTPAALVAARGAATLEDAFIAYLEEATGQARRPPATQSAHRRASLPRPHRRGTRRWFSPRRLLAYTIRETLELLRDPIRLGFGLFGTALLMLVFGFGVSTDVNNLSFAVLDRDQSPESRAYLEELAARPTSSRSRRSPTTPNSTTRLQSGDDQGRDRNPARTSAAISSAAAPPEVGAWIDGAMPFRAETIRGYLQGMHQLYLADPASRRRGRAPTASRYRDPLQIQSGLRQHLRHGARRHRADAGAVSRRF